jgi:peptidoglycan hydrolase-like protein with peptidoglycan-binding domain
MIQRGSVGLYQVAEVDEESSLWARDLSFGSRSTQVVDWQRKLVRIGLGPLEIDGWFGQATSDATTAFQVANGLEANGVVEASTRRNMAEALPPAPQASWLEQSGAAGSGGGSDARPDRS